MRKLFFSLLILLTFVGCIRIGRIEKYRIKYIDKNYCYKTNSSESKIYLTKSVNCEEVKGKIVLRIRVYDNVINYNNIVLSISSYKEENVDKEYYKLKEDKYKKPKFLSNVVITKKNGEKIIINTDEIRYTFEENPNTSIKEALLYLPEKLSGSITLELGRVKIGDEVYNVPKIYMQKYQETNSYSIVGGIVEKGGLNLPGYHSEGWIND